MPAWVPGDLLHVGAEAVATSGRWLDGDAVLKERRPRAYRHPSLDRRLSSMRSTAEARILLRLASARFGAHRFPTPVLLAMDTDAGWMIQSRMPGLPLFEALRTHTSADEVVSSDASSDESASGGISDVEAVNDGADDEASGPASTVPGDTAKWLQVMNDLGRLIRVLHTRSISHGDLTSHNVLWSEKSGLSLVDFGLGQLSPELEICGLDLQVLAECLQASHPNISGAMQAILTGYSAEVCTDELEVTRNAEPHSPAAGQTASNRGGSTVHSAAAVIARFDEIRSRVRYHG